MDMTAVQNGLFLSIPHDVFHAISCHQYTSNRFIIGSEVENVENFERILRPIETHGYILAE